MNAAHILNTLPKRFKPVGKRPLRGIFHFIIKGPKGGAFTVQVTPEACHVFPQLTGTPDCVIKTSDTVFIEIETGKMNPQVAFLTRRVRISNVAAFMEFSKHFVPYYKWKSSADKPRTDVGDTLPSREGPLKDVQILDFGRLYPAPLATMWLADLGARVIKVEHPQSPDPMRTYPPVTESGVGAGYLALNRNKFSLALDFTIPEGRAALSKIIAQSDVLVHSFRPERMRAWKLDYHAVQKDNPNIAYISLLGYPPQSRFANQASHDLNYLALSGILESSGTRAQPVIPGAQFADVLGAYNVVITVLLALLKKYQGKGGGEYIISLLHAALSAATLQMAYQPFAPEYNRRGAGILTGGMAAYNIYPCQDGKYIALAAVEPKFWDAFCDAIGHPEWKGSYFLDAGEQQQIIDELAAVIAQKPCAYWEELGQRHDVCLTPVLSFGEVSERLQQHQFGISAPVVDGILQIFPPFVKDAGPGLPPPKLGAHSMAVLRAAGFGNEEIEHLFHQGIVEQG